MSIYNAQIVLIILITYFKYTHTHTHTLQKKKEGHQQLSKTQQPSETQLLLPSELALGSLSYLSLVQENPLGAVLVSHTRIAQVSQREVTEPEVPR